MSAVTLISLMNMALIITKMFVLSSRYVVVLAFMLMILASFQFSRILMNYSQPSEKAHQSKWLATALVVFMTLSLVKNILPKSEGYNYMQDAVNWVQSHNTQNKPVFSEESRIRYYMGQPFITNNGDNWKVVTSAINSREILNYDYLLLSHSAKHPEREQIIAEQLPLFKEVKRFNSAKAKKSIVIYIKNDQ